jgi:hypothetical protein
VPNSRRRIKIRELLDDYDQSDLFDTRAQKIAWEEHFLGIALSGSESDIYKAKDHCIDLVKGGYPDMRFEISVCVDGVREIITKKGDPMAFVVFPKVFNTSKQLLEGGNVLKIKGKVDDRGSLIADRVERLK